MIEYPIGVSGQTLVLSNEVLGHFARHRQLRWYHREAGGQLFARVKKKRIVVAEATGPRKSDRRSRYSYEPDRVAEQWEIDEKFRDGLHFVGDWHTHPEDLPRPSDRDERSIAETVNRSSHTLNGLLLIVVGRKDPPQGLFVSISDGSMHFDLLAIGERRFRSNVRFI